MLDIFQLAKGKEIIAAFQAGHYLDAWQAAIDLQKTLHDTISKFDGVFGIKLNAAQEATQEDCDSMCVDLASLSCPVMATTDAEVKAIDPATILVIIQGIIAVLDFLKKRREQK